MKFSPEDKVKALHGTYKGQTGTVFKFMRGSYVVIFGEDDMDFLYEDELELSGMWTIVTDNLVGFTSVQLLDTEAVTRDE